MHPLPLKIVGFYELQISWTTKAISCYIFSRIGERVFAKLRGVSSDSLR
jgi:hypothetical protein